MSNTGDGSPDLAAQDEILQVMYWLLGERLADAVSVHDLLRFSTSPEPLIEGILDRLCAIGFVQRVAAGQVPRFTLTEEGLLEAGRRFADEFADMQKPGHGECGDPECDCHTSGRPEDCVHRR